MKKILWFAFSISLAANVFLLAKWLDAGVVVDHLRSEASRQRARSELSLVLVSRAWVGRSSGDLTVLSSDINREAGAGMSFEGDAVELGDLVFEVKSGVITEVRYID